MPLRLCILNLWTPWEAFQEGLVHMEWAQWWPKEANCLGILLTLSSKMHGAQETPGAIPWVEMVRRRTHYLVPGSGRRRTGRMVMAMARSTWVRTLWGWHV